MKTKKNKIATLDQFKDKYYGKQGTAKRDQLEAGYENFKIGALIYKPRARKNIIDLVDQLPEHSVSATPDLKKGFYEEHAGDL